MKPEQEQSQPALFMLHVSRQTYKYETYAAEIYSQAQIYSLCGRMDMALFKSRSDKLHGTPNSDMNLELSRR